MQRAVTAFVIVICGAVSALAASGTLEDQLRQQLRDARDQVSALQAQVATLQTEKAAAERERDALRKDVDAARPHAGGSHESAASRAQVAQAQAVVGQAADAVRQKEAERARMEAALTQGKAFYDACVAKNADLYRVGNEILDAYQKYSLSDGIAAREPFVGFHRVALENAIQGYGDRLYDGQFDPHAVRAPAPAAQQSQQAVPAATATSQQQTSSSSDSSSQAPH